MPAEFKHQRRMTGSLVGNPFFGKDESGREGTFFHFGNLSVHSLGMYTLQFNLYTIEPQGLRRRAAKLAEITSAPFQSYAAKELPDIQPSSQLIRVLKGQGCIISIKKRPFRDSLEPKDGEDYEPMRPAFTADGDDSLLGTPRVLAAIKRTSLFS
ncbi:velvet factor-domain-containing protein [Emericellopsis atlantica]|uniref:Velvet factor-domain-containing protein n=1 Tax=Emericellopsis atlantica TaxID=2614577 RepID=A0A9P7ZD52_9HYPO|nr:velvet factor-domain-containing protein [Emericellopsis atlantica]KAG9249637.1 velvet factor-domain-containing protein [Emericellopsis atlantica]